MGWRSNKVTRCVRCRMHSALCVCAAVPELDLRTRVLLLMHRQELSKSTATGNLALLALKNSEVRLHGDPKGPLQLGDLDHEAHRILMLFPCGDATELTPEFARSDRRPVTLLVPDGTWRQAAKIARRVPGLQQVERVALPPGPASRYQLRTTVRRNGLATLEAVARAMGMLEGPEVQAELEGLFSLMVERTLMTRRGVTESRDQPEPSPMGAIGC